MKPTVGRIVHYTYGEPHIDLGVSQDEGFCPALILRVIDDTGYLILKIFPPYDDEEIIRASYSETPRVGFWHWPPREDE